MLNIAFRAFSAGGARGVAGKVDDSKWMQEITANFMKGETRNKIEAPQNYGFTSVHMPPDMDKAGNITGAAEHFSSFIGGARSFPVAGSIDDRRHRLYGLAEGDVAMFRTATDQLQLHLAQDGGYFTGPQSKKLRMQLVADQQQQGATGSQGASSGGTAGSSGGGQQQGQQKGQKALNKKESNHYTEINGTMTQSVNKQHQITLQDKATGMEVNPDNKVYLGAVSGKGQFLRVLLEGGKVAKNVMGLFEGGGDGGGGGGGGQTSGLATSASAPIALDQVGNLSLSHIVPLITNAAGALSLQHAPSLNIDSSGNLALTEPPFGTQAFGRSSGAWTPVAALASPAFTGQPSAPTPSVGTNSDQLATTAFVHAAVSGVGAGLPEAPTDGHAYGRSNAAWLQVLKMSGDIVDGGNF
jgi:phage gp45-like